MGPAEGVVPAVRFAGLSKQLGMPPVNNIFSSVDNSLNGIGSFVNTMTSGRFLSRPIGNCRILDVANFGYSDEKLARMSTLGCIEPRVNKIK